MECDDLLLLRGGQDWKSRPEMHAHLCYTMAIPCANEIGPAEVFEDGTRSFRSHAGWGGKPEFLAIRDDLLWFPSTAEMWVLCLETRPLDDFQPLAGFAWRRVWQATKNIHTSTVAFRVNSQSELFRLETSMKGSQLMPFCARFFAFKQDVTAAFAQMQLTQESEKLLWKADLDKIGLDLLGISGVESDWFYTVVCDDGAFFTGDPVFCFPREASEDFDKHFADVAKRHDLSLQSGFLTKQTVEDLVLGHGARNAHPLESYVRKEENGP